MVGMFKVTMEIYLLCISRMADHGDGGDDEGDDEEEDGDEEVTIYATKHWSL